MRVIKYFKGHGLAILLIVALLAAQAFCDLALPNYTSQLVDVGIQQSGVDHASPEVMTESTTIAELHARHVSARKAIFRHSRSDSLLSDDAVALLGDRFSGHSQVNLNQGNGNDIVKRGAVLFAEGRQVIRTVIALEVRVLKGRHRVTFG